MNKPHTLLSLLLATLFLFSACEKLDVPTEESGSTDQAAESPTSNDSDTEAEDYSVAEAIANLHNGETEDIYVTGYIVGYVQHTSIKSSIFAAGNVRTNLLLADTPVETDSLKCLPVQLTTTNQACKATRIALNLCDNPDMLHQKVRLKGNLDLYMGVCGLIKAHDHSLLPNDFDYAAYQAELEAQQNEPKTDEEDPSTGQTNDGTNDESNTTPDKNDEEPSQTPDDPQDTSDDKEDPLLTEAREWFSTHGTEDNPFTINDFKTSIATYYPTIDEAGYKIADIYVRGYIVGYYTTSNKVVHFSTNANKTYATNIVLADSPDELKKVNCIVVELPSGSQLRSELNLFDNKKMLGKRIIILGNIDKYGIGLGVKSPRKYAFD